MRSSISEYVLSLDFVYFTYLFVFSSKMLTVYEHMCKENDFHLARKESHMFAGGVYSVTVYTRKSENK